LESRRRRRDAGAGQDLERLVLVASPSTPRSRVDLVDELHAIAAIGVARVVGSSGRPQMVTQRLPHLGRRAVTNT